jgi:hypothetical protein
MERTDSLHSLTLRIVTADHRQSLGCFTVRIPTRLLRSQSCNRGYNHSRHSMLVGRSLTTARRNQGTLAPLRCLLALPQSALKDKISSTGLLDGSISPTSDFLLDFLLELYTLFLQFLFPAKSIRL